MNQSAKQNRHGIALLELIGSIVLLAALIAVGAQMLSLIGAQRRASDWRAAACLEVQNTAEQVMAISWNELTPERLAQFQLAPEAAAALGDARLRVAMVDPPPEATARKIAIEITWPEKDVVARAPARLLVWRHQVMELAKP